MKKLITSLLFAAMTCSAAQAGGSEIKSLIETKVIGVGNCEKTHGIGDLTNIYNLSVNVENTYAIHESDDVHSFSTYLRMVPGRTYKMNSLRLEKENDSTSISIDSDTKEESRKKCEDYRERLIDALQIQE